MKILLVDDSEPMRRFIRTLLATTGAAFHECAGGRGAVEMFREERPDLVLMDIMMPDMDGLEASRRIRAEFPDARIVIVTYYDDQGLRDAALAAGVSGYVLKENLLSLPDIISRLA